MTPELTRMGVGAVASSTGVLAKAAAGRTSEESRVLIASIRRIKYLHGDDSHRHHFYPNEIRLSTTKSDIFNFQRLKCNRTDELLNYLTI